MGPRKRVMLTEHAKKRLAKYGLEESLVLETLEYPNEVLEGYAGRKVAHKYLDSLMLRVVYEENDIIRVITVYPARKTRYAKRG